MAPSSFTDATIRLSDGRTLNWRTWGDPDGPAVIAFHGSPGSRVFWPGEPETIAAGARLIVPDRPGYGGSEPVPGRPIGGWAADVAELADSLGLARFGVSGWSGGAPYAAAVAALLPDRLTGVCITCSASITCILPDVELDKDDRHIIELVKQHSSQDAVLAYAEELRPWAEGLAADPASLVTLDELSPGDRWLFEDPELAARFNDLVAESVRQGAAGAAQDWVALWMPWGFTLEQIQPHVHLWHGAQDAVNLDDFRRVADAIPSSTLTVWPDVGHFGPAKYWGEVLAAALGR
jgi:pimeloyl-ACP methyl ester carboxylesterase